MSKFLLSEQFRLEVHWDRVLRPKAGIMHLVNAYFSGPVLKQALQLNDNDHIDLDFCTQFYVIVKNVYVAQLHWDEVTYNKNDTIGLKNARVEYDFELSNIPNLEDKDYLVIDTQDHEIEKHYYNLLYPTYVINDDDDLYNYRR